MNSLIVLGAYAIIFLLLAVGFLFIFRSAALVEASKKNMQSIYESLLSRDNKRVTELEQERQKYGAISKDNKVGTVAKWLMNTDDLLVYSGVGIKYPWLNTTTFLALMISVWGFCFLLFGVVFGAPLFGFAFATILVFIPIGYMRIKRMQNYKQTEGSLTTFVDIIANSAMVSNSIIVVLEEAADNVADPIRSAVYRATAGARATGDHPAMIRQLCRQIEHPIFERFIRNLDVCSRNDAAFSSIARDYTQQLNQQLASAKRLSAIRKNGVSEALMLAIISLVIAVITPPALGITVADAIGAMLHTTVGNVLLGIELLIYGGTAIYCLKGVSM